MGFITWSNLATMTLATCHRVELDKATDALIKIFGFTPVKTHHPDEYFEPNEHKQFINELTQTFVNMFGLDDCGNACVELAGCDGVNFRELAEEFGENALGFYNIGFKVEPE